MSETQTIFIDEAGYTGQDLLNADQPILTLASLCSPEDKCRELKDRFFSGVQAAELKYKNLAKHKAGRRMVLGLLGELAKDPKPVRLYIAHKPFALVTKMVDLVVEPALLTEGVDLYDRGGNIALSNLLFGQLTASAEPGFRRDFMARFQSMMRDRTPESYRRFFEPLFSLKFGEPLQSTLDFIRLGHVKVGEEIIDNQTHPLDIAASLTLTLAVLWRRDLGRESQIVLIHDASSAMARVKEIWDAVVDPANEPQEIGYDVRRMELPVGVNRTLAEDSKDWAGLQLADVLAGAAARYGLWVEKGGDASDEYGRQLAQIIDKNIYMHAIWPSDAVTPDAIGAVGGNASPFENLMQIIARAVPRA